MLKNHYLDTETLVFGECGDCRDGEENRKIKRAIFSHTNNDTQKHSWMGQALDAMWEVHAIEGGRAQ